MGYYTDYTLTFNAYPPDTALSALDDAVDELGGGIFEQLDSDTWYANAKWYNCDHDMWCLSTSFPKVLFCLHGDGESGDDLWDEYWQDGACQHCHAEIPPYDPSQMIQFYLDADGRLTEMPPAPDVPDIVLDLPDM